MIGHIAVRSKLGKLVASRRIPNTILFTGIRGIGKSLAAHELSHKLLCANVDRETGQPCGICSSCKVLSSGSHPDLHVLDCSGDGGAVDSIRELLTRLSLSSFSGGNRVAILDNADELNLAASNALLKSLEEPREGVYFLLVAETASRLPSTVLSRCQQWHFNRLPDSEVENIVAGLDRKVPQHVIHLAEGSVHAALTLSDSSLPVEDIALQLKKICSGDSTAVMELTRMIASEKDLIAAKLAIVRTQARACMENALGNPRDERLWSAFLANIVDAERLLLDRNFNPVTTLFTLFSILNPNHSTTFTNLRRGGTLLQDIF